MPRAPASFSPPRRQAIAAVKALQARGVRSIDVGCMQINLSYHPHAFRDLDQAFDPHANAAYAERFLTQLYRRKPRLEAGDRCLSFLHTRRSARIIAGG